MRNKCFEKCYKIRWKTPVIIAKHFKKAFLQNTSVWLFLSVGNTIFQPVWKKENFFFPSGFSFTDTDDSQGKGRDHLLFHSTTSTRSRTSRHLFENLHVRWLSHIFNRIACIYQAATRWDLPPYRITIWLIDDVTLSLFVYVMIWF